MARYSGEDNEEYYNIRRNRRSREENSGERGEKAPEKRSGVRGEKTPEQNSDPWAHYKSILPKENGSYRTAGRCVYRNPEDGYAERHSDRGYPEGERAERRSGRRGPDSGYAERRSDRNYPDGEHAERRSDRGYPDGERAERRSGRRASENDRARDRGSSRSGTFRGSRGRKRPEGWIYTLNFYKGYFLYPLFFLYYEAVLRLLSGNGWFSHPGYVFGFALAAGLFTGGLTMCIPRKQRRVVNLIILTAVGVYFAIECVLHSVYINYMSPTNILSGGGNVAGKYSGEMFRGILFGIPKGLLFILPPVIVFRLARKRARKKPYPPAAAILYVVLGVAGTLLMANVAAKGPQGATYTAQFTFTRATDTFGLLTSTRLSLRNSIFGNPHSSFHEEGESAQPTPAPEEPTFDKYTAEPTPTPVSGDKNEMAIDFGAVSGNSSVANLTEYVKTRTASSKNSYTGMFKGKNLIMIAAESYAGCFITPELTPTLWRMTHSGFYFSDYYQVEWGGSTSTGEMSTLVGIAPQWGDESVIMSAKNNNYFTMGNQLQRLGYSSAAFHNGSSDYYQRHTTHLNLGYNQWIANDTGISDLCGRGWVNDSEMFEHTIPLYVNKSPFSIYYMTLSGHAPYNKTYTNLVDKWYDRVNAAVGDQYEETTKYYICYQMELEESMRILIHELEEAGIADDTVIMVVGDHYPYGLGAGEAWGNDKSYIEDLLKTDISLHWNRDRNNLIIWSECLEHGLQDYACEISSPMFNLDILPTLSNLFGVEYDSRLLPGRDVFSDASPLVFWDSRDWITDKGRYLAISGTYIPNEGEPYDEEYYQGISKQVENKMLFSRVAVENDYYGLLFGPDTVTLAGEILYPEGGVTAEPYAAG